MIVLIHGPVHPVLGFLVLDPRDRVSSVELSVVFSVEKMSVEKNMTLNSTINNTKFFLKNNVLPQSLLLLMRLAWIFAKRSKKVCPSWPQGQKRPYLVEFLT